MTEVDHVEYILTGLVIGVVLAIVGGVLYALDMFFGIGAVASVLLQAAFAIAVVITACWAVGRAVYLLADWYVAWEED